MMARLSERSRTGHKLASWRAAGLAVALTANAAMLGGCAVGETFVHGQQVSAEQLQQVPIGSSREQVILALGTPSTTGIADGEVLYYVSQKSQRKVAFMNPTITDRRILAVYLDKEDRVGEIAEYGLKDGKVFDYLARKTPTTGSDLAFISQVLSGLVNPGL